MAIELLSDYRRAPPITTKELVRFTPDHMKEQEDAPVFLLKVPTVREKIAFESAMEYEGLRYPQDMELYAVLRDEIKLQVVDHEQPGLLEILDEAEGIAGQGETLSTELAEKVEQINRTLRQHSRMLGQLYADRRRYLGMVWLLRAQMFLVGIEGGGDNVPAIERKNGYLTDACIDAIEDRFGNGTITAIGQRTVLMMMPDEGERKNSESLEPSPADPETSTAAPSLPTARRGKSLATATNATLN